MRHHHYVPQNIQNDIAVVKVKGVIEFNQGVQPIRISASPIPAGSHVQLTGWGKVHVNKIYLYLSAFAMSHEYEFKFFFHTK